MAIGKWFRVKRWRMIAHWFSAILCLIFIAIWAIAFIQYVNAGHRDDGSSTAAGLLAVIACSSVIVLNFLLYLPMLARRHRSKNYRCVER